MAAQFLNVFLMSSVVIYLCTLSSAQTCTEFVVSTTCGGNIVADSGIIRYNHSDYGVNSGCFWLVRSNINSRVEVRLLHDTFTSNEAIEIHTLNLNGDIGGSGSISDMFFRHGDYVSKHFDGPIILIKFSTFNRFNDFASAVPSFIMFFRGCGPEITNPPNFSHFHREKIPGETEIITYSNDGESYPNNQLITYLGLRHDRAIVNNDEGDWKIKIMFQDMQPSSNCLFGDSLKFNNCGFLPLCAFDEHDNSIWRFCQRNSNETHILPKRSLKYNNIFPDEIGILAVFSSNGSQGRKEFIFEW
ncbi:hypothetical protein HA402_010428 [Bradysia odoriphaga]|nr:hypothetical protein HA402_010428 [Bradysia odoriphaga]